MTVWLVNPYDNLPCEGNRPQRYELMAEAFVRAGHEVVYWTSDFSHATKQKRVCRVRAENRHIRIVQIPTRPYPKNICLARVLSHRQLARDFERLGAAETHTPDLVVASVPPLGLCAAAQRLARRFGAVFVADIQDAWPETFERVLPRFVWTLLGLRKAAQRIYCGADGLSAVAQRYLDLAQAYGATAPAHLAGHCIAQGGQPEPRSPHHPLALAYAGNMSLSYDLATVIRAVRDLEDVTLDLAGDGPDRARLMQLADSPRIRFHGYLGEQDLAALLRRCDVGLVPMFPASCVGVPGKLADYAAAGLRVIESLGGETENLVASCQAGQHYTAGSEESLKSAIRTLAQSTAPGNAADFARKFDATPIMDAYVQWCQGLTARATICQNRK